MSENLFKHMRTKVKLLLNAEMKMTADERKAQQWQLLFTIRGTQYVVGKGGVNTMFYVVGDKERVLCYPDELLAAIDFWDKKKYSEYAIYSKAGKPLETGIKSEREALSRKAPTGSFIVAIAGTKKVRKYVMAMSLIDLAWKPFKKD